MPFSMLPTRKAPRRWRPLRFLSSALLLLVISSRASQAFIGPSFPKIVAISKRSPVQQNWRSLRKLQPLHSTTSEKADTTNTSENKTPETPVPIERVTNSLPKISNTSLKTVTSFGESPVFEGSGDESDDLRYARELSHRGESFLRWTPMVVPIVAFVFYDATAELFAQTLDLISNNNWVAVDGGQYQAKIIAPAINGVVVPAISILFANLIGTTISTLRQRQLDIRTAINMEAGQLRILQSLLDVFPSPRDRDVCRRYLTQYTTRLIAESQPTIAVEALDSYSLDTELNGILSELNRLSSSSLEDVPPSIILGNAYNACSKLYEERARRVSALRSLFPPLHFAIVTALAVSICIAFLLESNQSLLVFLNAIQLRILWVMLVGTFTALAIVCYDLGNPFRGSYQISRSVDQLYTIRLALRASLMESSSNSNRKVVKESEATNIVDALLTETGPPLMEITRPPCPNPCFRERPG